MLKREPVLVGAIAQIAVILAATFGLDISKEEVAAIVTAVMVLVGILQRQSVSPA